MPPIKKSCKLTKYASGGGIPIEYRKMFRNMNMNDFDHVILTLAPEAAKKLGYGLDTVARVAGIISGYRNHSGSYGK